MSLTNDAPLEIVDRFVIVGGTQRHPGGSRARRQRGFTSLVQLPNEDLLLTYRLGVGRDRTANGVQMLTRSTDGGQTWDEPIPVFAQPGWDCFGMAGLKLLPDGTVLLFLGRSRTRPGVGLETKAFIGLETFVTRSTDHGHTWSDLSGPLKIFPGITEFFGCAQVPQLEDGRLMLGVIGTPAGYADWASAIIYSSDNCQTFHDLTIIADTPGMDFCDNDLIRLDDGRWLAVIRTDQPPFESYQSYSADDGRTWSPVEPCGFKGQNPTLFRLPSGAIVCAYRDREPGRPGLSCSVTNDGGGTWHFIGQLYRGSHWHCGYANFAHLPDGRLFCSYYTSLVDGNSEVHGLYLREIGQC
jgi:hypothetical protein